MHQTVKVLATGRNQAVRLPLEFRFDVAEVFIRRDPVTGDVVLSRSLTRSLDLLVLNRCALAHWALGLAGKGALRFNI